MLKNGRPTWSTLAQMARLSGSKILRKRTSAEVKNKPNQKLLTCLIRCTSRCTSNKTCQKRGNHNLTCSDLCQGRGSTAQSRWQGRRGKRMASNKGSQSRWLGYVEPQPSHRRRLRSCWATALPGSTLDDLGSCFLKGAAAFP